MSAVPGFAAIVLAAGAGRRFGGGKLTAAYRGRPLIAWSRAAADAAPVSEILLVVGADAGPVTGVVESMATTRPVRIVRAANWAEGMSASLRAAGAALRPGAAGAFVFLGDMPRIPHDIGPPLAKAVEVGASAAVPTFAGRRGHPVLLGAALLARLPELVGDHGARALLGSVDDAVAAVPVDDPGILFDVDVPEAISGLGT